MQLKDDLAEILPKKRGYVRASRRLSSAVNAGWREMRSGRWRGVDWAADTIRKAVRRHYLPVAKELEIGAEPHVLYMVKLELATRTAETWKLQNETRSELLERLL